MVKQFLISVLVIFLATMVVDFFVHVSLLGPDYAALPNLYRSEEDSANYFQYMLLAHVLLGIGLTWVYRMGRDDSAWIGQGLRFGAALIVLITIPIYLIFYAVQPMPAVLVAKQILFEGVGMLLIGMLAAYTNRS